MGSERRERGIEGGNVCFEGVNGEGRDYNPWFQGNWTALDTKVAK